MDHDLDAAHRDALERAMKIALRDPGRAEQLQGMLADRPRRAVLEFCSYHCQMNSLRLRPWQSPPVHISEDDPDDERDDVMGNGAARKLLRQMLAAKISRFEPDPLTALQRVNKRRR